MIQLDLNPSTGKLKNFGLISAIVFGVLALLSGWRGSLFGVSLAGSAHIVAAGLASVGAMALLLSRVWPKGNLGLYVMLTVITFPIGIVVSNVMLVVLFYGLFTPIAVVFRIIGRDILNRRLEPEKDSYWVAYPVRQDPSHYFRQY